MSIKAIKSAVASNEELKAAQATLDYLGDSSQNSGAWTVYASHEIHIALAACIAYRESADVLIALLSKHPRTKAKGIRSLISGMKLAKRELRVYIKKYGPKEKKA